MTRIILYRLPAAVFTMLFLLAACDRAPDKMAAPVEITRDSYCSLDGMLLADHPGPKAQIHYAQGAPEFFCDTVEMFSLYLQPEQQKRVTALFVNDMGKTDWEKPAGQWIDARQAVYVVGSPPRLDGTDLCLIWRRKCRPRFRRKRRRESAPIQGNHPRYGNA